MALVTCSFSGLSGVAAVAPWVAAALLPFGGIGLFVVGGPLVWRRVLLPAGLVPQGNLDNASDLCPAIGGGVHSLLAGERELVGTFARVMGPELVLG